MALTKTFANNAVLSAEEVNTHLAHHVPNAGDPYDTGWQTLLSGSLIVTARRVGLLAMVRVDLSAWVDTGANDVVNINGGSVVLPSDMRPAAEVYGTGIGNQPDVAIQGVFLSVRPGGSLAVIKPRGVSHGIVATATYLCA